MNTKSTNNSHFEASNVRSSWKYKQVIFDFITRSSGILMTILVFGIFITLVFSSYKSFQNNGFSFLFSSKWNPVTDQYGALPFIVGTLLTSFLALFISLPFSFAIAVLLGEYSRKGFFSSFLKSVVELLAGIPSVIYGFWGLYFLVDYVKPIQKQFGLAPTGLGIFTSSVILAIMVIPYSASIAREVIELVPKNLKEAAYALGSTRYEVIKKIIIPYASSGIFAGVVLSLGRALGETMAVTMLIGNSNHIPSNIFDTGNTMASVIANEYNEAFGIQASALLELGLILLIISTIINITGKFIIKKMSVHE